MSKTTTLRHGATASKPHELDSNIVKALSHPLRMRILTRLNEGVASPNEMAKEFEESLPLVSYHVRILRELDCIELVRTTPRRGAIEHHYRALTRPFLDDDDWAQLPPSARKAVSNTVLSKVLGDVRDAVAAGHVRRAHRSPPLLRAAAARRAGLAWARRASRRAARVGDRGAGGQRGSSCRTARAVGPRCARG